MCRARLSTMQEQQLTQRDLRKKLGLQQVSTCVGAGQLAYLGHIARLPSDRLEPKFLSAWLPDEALQNSYKGATCSRHVFWKRLTELLQFSDLDKSQWTQRWQELAQ